MSNILGGESNPVRMNNNGTVRLPSNKWSGTNKKNYDENYDRIFGKKEKDKPATEEK